MRLSPAAQARVHLLTQVFEHIALTRFQGLGLLHPGLRVQAVGFAEVQEGPQQVCLQGVLITPWFMSLLRLPLEARQGAGLRPGESATRSFAAQRCDFIAAHEPLLGHFESCSLFSPMADFADQTAAVLTAHEVLRQMAVSGAAPLAPTAVAPSRAQPAVPAPAVTLSTGTPSPQLSEPMPARRGFLLGLRAKRVTP
ncbi:[NiFe]-hydrogenase assembly chaperone HybE [Ideonella paludis]|uniref:[NiFe]-hydrogenase assembly chaperone HybE n=1 Tax=Ideonella paludis TaxID=1233411 RepID=A0ABS5E0Z7_9BURK|nr:[NiFe]-hydrogenase assembly chaperone HybE [Ideonella paludis]MBQ0937091.1 [NiFe]-hydrogenase assembly chaperone HybE [Ideonella paludis]